MTLEEFKKKYGSRTLKFLFECYIKASGSRRDSLEAEIRSILANLESALENDKVIP